MLTDIKRSIASLPPRWWICVPFIVTAAVFTATACHEPAWEWLGVMHDRPYFMDLVAILSASDAVAAGADPYAMPMLFDPFGRPHVYGPWWLHLSALHLTRASYVWLGLSLFIISVAALAWTLRPRNGPQAFLAALLLSSPPLLLAYERGNNDLVIVLLFIAAVRLDPHAKRLHVAVLFVVIAAMLKIYPLAAAVMLARQSHARRTLIALSCLAGGLLLGFYIWREDFQKIWGLIPRPKELYGYGMTLIAELWTRADIIKFGQTGIVVALACGTALTLWTRAFRRSLLERMTTGIDGGYFLAGGSMWAFCYLTNSNYPYRLSLLVLAIAAWFRLWQTSPAVEALSARRLLILLAILAWIRPLFDLTNGHGFYALGASILGLEYSLSAGLTLVVLAAIGLRIWLMLSAMLAAPNQPPGKTA